MEILELNNIHIESIKKLYKEIFMSEPWNDDWSDAQQLHKYIMDLIDNPSSLTYGLYEGDELIGLSMGSIRHWWTGTEYFINELCIKSSKQGQGFGSTFLKLIEDRIKERGIVHIFLQTERNVLAYPFYLKNGYVEMLNHVSLHKNLNKLG